MRFTFNNVPFGIIRRQHRERRCGYFLSSYSKKKKKVHLKLFDHEPYLDDGKKQPKQGKIYAQERVGTLFQHLYPGREYPILLENFSQFAAVDI